MNHYYRKKNDTAKACSTMWEPNHNNRFVILFSLSILVPLIGLERAEVGIVLMTLTPHRIPRLLSMNFIDPSWFRGFLIDDGRFYYFRYWLSPIGKSLGIKSTKAKPPVPNKSLEDAYTKSSKLNHKTVSKRVLSCSMWKRVFAIIGTSSLPLAQSFSGRLSIVVIEIPAGTSNVVCF